MMRRKNNKTRQRIMMRTDLRLKRMVVVKVNLMKEANLRKGVQRPQSNLKTMQ